MQLRASESPRFRRVPFLRDVASDPEGDGSSHSGPAHVAFGSLDRLGPCDIAISWLNPTPHKIAVYASPWSSPSTPQHSLPAGATPYPDRTFTGWNAPAFLAHQWLADAADIIPWDEYFCIPVRGGVTTTVARTLLMGCRYGKK